VSSSIIQKAASEEHISRIPEDYGPGMVNLPHHHHHHHTAVFYPIAKLHVCANEFKLFC
jgi:hypothetical protein